MTANTHHKFSDFCAQVKKRNMLIPSHFTAVSTPQWDNGCNYPWFLASHRMGFSLRSL